MVKILVINGPNLNLLGQRDTVLYGKLSLEEMGERVREHGRELGAEVELFQSNSEGAIIDYLQQSSGAHGIIINPGALTHYGLSLRDALSDTRLPIVEVHLSNIYSREEWRARSVIAPVAVGQVSGLGWQGYLYALDFLATHLKEEGAW